MKYFGPPGDAPVYDDAFRSPTPVGALCFACKKPIRLGDQGFLIPHARPAKMTDEPWHRTCFLEDVIGPAARDIMERAHDTTPRPSTGR